jgi:hypothetical protein
VEPRGYEHDGFEVTLWTYYEPVTPQVPATDYANALERLHADMRTIELPTPHFTERVADAPRNVASTPLLDDADRELLSRDSSWLWWQSTAVIPETSSRTARERCAISSGRCALVRRGPRSARYRPSPEYVGICLIEKRKT